MFISMSWETGYLFKENINCVLIMYGYPKYYPNHKKGMVTISTYKVLIKHISKVCMTET